MSLAFNHAFWQTACYTVVLMPYNGPGIADVWEIEARQPNNLLKIIK